jgi:hypothetical protein
MPQREKVRSALSTVQSATWRQDGRIKNFDREFSMLLSLVPYISAMAILVLVADASEA